MNPILGNLFKKAGKGLVDSVGKVLDDVITNKEEKAQIKLELEKEINRHNEVLLADATKQLEIEVQDRSSARTRESEFVKATGHIDYLMWFLAIVGVGIFGYMVWFLLNHELKKEIESLVFHLLGIIEGSMLLNVYNYYFGSSAGSRIKDMKK